VDMTLIGDLQSGHTVSRIRMPASSVISDVCPEANQSRSAGTDSECLCDGVRQWLSAIEIGDR